MRSKIDLDIGRGRQHRRTLGVTSGWRSRPPSDARYDEAGSQRTRFTYLRHGETKTSPPAVTS
jgi:hypothetical protein